MPEEIAKNVGWDLRYVQLERGRLTAGMTTAPIGDLVLSRERWGRSVHMCGQAPADLLVFGVMIADGMMRHQGRSASPDDLIVMRPGDEIDFLGVAGLDAVNLHVSRRRLEALAQIFESPSSLLIKGTPIAHLPPGQARALHQRMCRSITNVPDSVWPAEETSGILEAFCLAATRAAPPDSLPCNPLTRSWHARRARAYIEDHLTAPLRIEDISLAAGLEIRTLHRCFKELYGAGPIHYARVRRLNEIRRILLKGSSNELTVTEAATEYGFGHLGRFAAAYNSMFGESPSESLRTV